MLGWGPESRVWSRGRRGLGRRSGRGIGCNTDPIWCFFNFVSFLFFFCKGKGSECSGERYFCCCGAGKEREGGGEREVDGRLLDINPSILLNFLIKNTSSNPFFLPLTNLPLTIKIPDRLRQRFDHVRVSPLKEIEYFMRGDDVGFASAMGLV